MTRIRRKYNFIKSAVLLTLTVVVWQAADSQSHEKVLDSLLRGKSTEEKLNSLHEYYKEIRYEDLMFAELICDTALSLSNETSDTSLIARAFLDRGTIHYFNEEYDSAMILYNNSIIYFKLVQDSLGVVKSYQNLSIIYRKLNKIKDALQLLEEGLKISKSINNPLKTMDIYQGIGNLYYSKSEFGKSLAYYDSAKLINSVLNDPLTDLILLSNIASIYETQELLNESLVYNRKALKVADSLGYAYEKAVILKNMGAVYLQLGETMKALDVLFESLYLRDSLNLEGAKARTLILIGKAYEFEGNLERANEMYIQSLEVLQEIKDMRQVAHALTYIGKNLQLQNQYENARAYYKTALSVAKEYELNLEISECYKHLVLIYGELQQEDSVLKYIDLYADVKNKISIGPDEYSSDTPDVSSKETASESGHRNNESEQIDKNTRGLILINWMFGSVIIAGLVLFIFVLISLMMIRKHRRKY